ncbi:MAG: molybdopterin-synthase adenylyltransferase MoeB [Anaerolineales bacterium]|jgi:molybdopterin/thiamine biosynthesis adenylyltransferase/rhodanese-related sulfurtransferase
MSGSQKPRMISGLSADEFRRYSRQLLLPEIGLTGQRKLKSAAVLIVGTGGLGSPAAIYLAAAGVGRIGLVDHDEVELTNLHRQVLHGSSNLGERKVESARSRLLDINPQIQVDIYDEIFSAGNALKISQPYDVIVDASDNFPTRYLVNDVCVLSGKPDVYGSVFRYEGQASVFWSQRGPCYRCIFPAPPPPDLVPSCAEGGVFGVVPGVIGTIQATETLKLILEIGETLIGHLLIYDSLAMRFDDIRLKKNPRCAICGREPEIRELIDYEDFCGITERDSAAEQLPAEREIDASELADRLKGKGRIRLIDVREPHELEISHIAGADSIPLGSLAAAMDEFDRETPIVLVCRAGTRSARALGILRGAGFRNVKNLRGGINAWAEEVDPSQPVY